MTRLPTLLAELEDGWRHKGMPPAGWLAPGVPANDVQFALREAGLDVPDEIVEWFGWHNGTIGSELMPYLGPTGWKPLSVAEALDARTQSAEMAEEVNEPSYSEEQLTMWEPAWLPIARDVGMGLLLADLSGSESDRAPVLVFYWDDEARYQAASINDAVQVWIDVLNTYAVWLPDEGRWDNQFEKVPIPQRFLL